MDATGVVAIARYVIRNRQHIAALRTGDGAAMLSTPGYADELASLCRPPETNRGVIESKTLGDEDAAKS